MFLNRRKFLVWIISLAAVVLVYLLYINLSDIPEIRRDHVAKFTGRAGVFDSNVSAVGQGLKVGEIEKAKYLEFDENKKVVGEFGFAKLLHQTEDRWEIDKPYRNLYRDNFKCFITADKGEVFLEPGADKPNPKDSKLIGNVVIHLVSGSGNKIKKSNIYLDDITFISSISMFKTTGPVKFVSADAYMLGRGLEMIYNQEKNKLEFLRITHLETLHIRQSSKRSLFSSEPGDTQDPSSDAGTMEPAAKDTTPKTTPSTSADPQKTQPREGELYRCILSENVVIDSAEQIVFSNEIYLNDIVFKTASNGESADGNDVSKKEPKDAAAASDDSTKQAVAGESEKQETVITCDNGILIVPMSSQKKLKTPSADAKIPNPEQTKGKTTFLAQKIIYNASTGDTRAEGYSKLTFYPKDAFSSEPNALPVPVTVTSQKKAEFLPDLNQVFFEGNCICNMTRQYPNLQQQYKLASPKLTIDLAKDKAESSSQAADIEHITAHGGVVNLSTIKMAGEKFLGGVELKCLRFDYDPAQQSFLATGPGTIVVDNSWITESDTVADAKTSKFGLQKPCFALVRDFATLEYLTESNQLIAKTDDTPLSIEYFPIVKGQYGRKTTATAGEIEINFINDNGQNRISTLHAKGGITYEEEPDSNAKKKRNRKGIFFSGTGLFYNANSNMMTVWGDKFHPCFLNGVSVDGIEYNLKTGSYKAKAVGPGMLY